VPLDRPSRVVGLAELEQRQAELLDGVEGPDPEEILLEGADEAFGASIPLGRADGGGRAFDAEEAQLSLEGVGQYCEPWSCRTARPRATFRAKPPKWRRTPWRIGSSASKRVPWRSAWMPTHSALQWSRATNTAARPSPVTAVVRSVPHITSTASGMMVPSWLLGPRGAPAREGASRSCSRISRSTRRFEVRTPPWRSRAQTLRWPSPWNGLATSTPRIASTSAASGIGPTGPGRRCGAVRAGSRCR
jgi:hypothetical protein